MRRFVTVLSAAFLLSACTHSMNRPLTTEAEMEASELAVVNAYWEFVASRLPNNSPGACFNTVTKNIYDYIGEGFVQYANQSGRSYSWERQPRAIFRYVWAAPYRWSNQNTVFNVRSGNASNFTVREALPRECEGLGYTRLSRVFLRDNRAVVLATSSRLDGHYGSMFYTFERVDGSWVLVGFVHPNSGVIPSRSIRAPSSWTDIVPGERLIVIGQRIGT